MTHYGQIFTINRLQLAVHLGYYDDERGEKQPIEVDMRLYFPAPPDCARTDKAPFIDYAILVEAVKACAASRQFALIEYLATELFSVSSKILAERCGPDIRLWLRLTKTKAPIEGLAGGASYVLSDLPAGATFPPAA